MANRWIGVALVGCCLTATPVVAQGPVPSSPMNCGTCGSSAAVPGPMTSTQAPPGPSDDLGLPANIPNAFGCDTPCSPCCPRVYADFAYLAWWFRSPSFPPLVTSSLAPASATTGSLADPFAVPLITDQTLRYRNAFSGGRVTLGYFLDDKQLSAFEASAFIVGQGTVSATVGSNGAGVPTIASPYFDFATGTAAAFPYSTPGVALGGVKVSSAARLFGGEGNFVCNYPDCCICCVPFPCSLLVGARYLNLQEKLSIDGLTQAVGTTPFVASQDSFRTLNQFIGGQVGGRIGWSFGPWFIAGQGKIGIGQVMEQVSIAGSTTAVVPGVYPVSVPAHLYAVASNSGNFTKNAFAYVPEVEARFGYRFNANLLAYVGYNFLYINKVARPGNQIDPVIDATQSPALSGAAAVPGFTRPAALPITQSSFWAQGVNVGIEITY